MKRNNTQMNLFSAHSHEVINVARVLVVDDEQIIANVLKEVLVDEGHEVQTAYNGATALRMLECPPLPEIVVIDLFMPGISGRAIVEEMRRTPSLRDIPVILITGAVRRDEDLPQSGAYHDVIAKPFDVGDVAARVQSVLTACK